MISRIPILPTVVCAAVLGAHPAYALDVPRPTINIPRPTISVPRPTVNIPRPTVNIPRPTISVPHPTVNVARPTVSVPQVSAPKIDAHKADVPNLNNPHAPSVNAAAVNAAPVKLNSPAAVAAPANSPAAAKAVANSPAATVAAASPGGWSHDSSPVGWTHVNGQIVYLDGHWNSVPAPAGDPGPSAAVRNSPVLNRPDAGNAAPAAARASPLGSPVIGPKVELAGPKVSPSVPQLGSRDMSGASQMRPYSSSTALAPAIATGTTTGNLPLLPPDTPPRAPKPFDPYALEESASPVYFPVLVDQDAKYAIDVMQFMGAVVKNVEDRATEIFGNVIYPWGAGPDPDPNNADPFGTPALLLPPPVTAEKSDEHAAELLGTTKELLKDEFGKRVAEPLGEKAKDAAGEAAGDLVNEAAPGLLGKALQEGAQTVSGKIVEKGVEKSVDKMGEAGIDALADALPSGQPKSSDKQDKQIAPPSPTGQAAGIYMPQDGPAAVSTQPTPSTQQAPGVINNTK